MEWGRTSLRNRFASVCPSWHTFSSRARFRPLHAGTTWPSPGLLSTGVDTLNNGIAERIDEQQGARGKFIQGMIIARNMWAKKTLTLKIEELPLVSCHSTVFRSQTTISRSSKPVHKKGNHKLVMSHDLSKWRLWSTTPKMADFTVPSRQAHARQIDQLGSALVHSKTRTSVREQQNVLLTGYHFGRLTIFRRSCGLWTFVKPSPPIRAHDIVFTNHKPITKRFTSGICQKKLTRLQRICKTQKKTEETG